MLSRFLRTKKILIRPFSQKIDFEKKDIEDYSEYNEQFYVDKAYLKLTDYWKKPLERKLARRARRNERLKNQQPPKAQEPKFVVHNPALPLKLPVKPYNIFAILSLNGTQYKLMQDDTLTINQLPHYDINDQVIFDGINLIGTDQFTILGRPVIKNAKIFATVTEHSRAEKLIVFKMKRRKGYKNTRGHSHETTSLKIDKIEFEIEDDMLKKAISLID